jgi:hypothetical protein
MYLLRPRLTSAPHLAVRAVAGHDQVRGGELGQLVGFVFEQEIHAQRGRPGGQDREQPVPAQAEPVPGKMCGPLALDAYLVFVPTVGAVPDVAGTDRIHPEQVVEKVVPEHHAPAVRDPGWVALDHGHLMCGVGQLGQDREVQTRRPAADTDDPHLVPLPF